MKIGLYGGSFDPIHHGHLILARQAMEQLSLDRIVFIPAFVSPFKQETKPAPAALRLEMVRAAIDGEAGFECSDIEVLRESPSYSIDTVRKFRAAFPDAEVYYLIGDDNLPLLNKWHDIDRLRELVTFVVLSRDAIQAPAGMPVINRSVDISSTDIRNRIACGRSIRYLLPMSVSLLIDNHGLYLNE
jgi:nicotinate-nucleotide adenylyltransferase